MFIPYKYKCFLTSTGKLDQIFDLFFRLETALKMFLYQIFLNNFSKCLCLPSELSKMAKIDQLFCL